MKQFWLCFFLLSYRGCVAAAADTRMETEWSGQRFGAVPSVPLQPLQAHRGPLCTLGTGVEAARQANSILASSREEFELCSFSKGSWVVPGAADHTVRTLLSEPKGTDKTEPRSGNSRRVGGGQGPPSRSCSRQRGDV